MHKQTGPITIHSSAKLSTQCNKIQIHLYYIKGVCHKCNFFFISDLKNNNCYDVNTRHCYNVAVFDTNKESALRSWSGHLNGGGGLEAYRDGRRLGLFDYSTVRVSHNYVRHCRLGDRNRRLRSLKKIPHHQ